MDSTTNGHCRVSKSSPHHHRTSIALHGRRPLVRSKRLWRRPPKGLMTRHSRVVNGSLMKRPLFWRTLDFLAKKLARLCTHIIQKKGDHVLRQGTARERSTARRQCNKRRTCTATTVLGFASWHGSIASLARRRNSPSSSQSHSFDYSIIGRAVFLPALWSLSSSHALSHAASVSSNSNVVGAHLGHWTSSYTTRLHEK